MNAPSTDIKDILVATTALGLTFATNLFIGKEPVEPDNCVTIFDTPGRSPLLTFNQTDRAERPSIQIRVRNRSYLTGWTLIHDIQDRLHGLSQETWNSTLYSVIVCTSGPAMLDWDNNNRVRFIINFDIQRR